MSTNSSRPIISIHVGGAGCAIGESCWDTFRKEHSLDAEGKRSADTAAAATKNKKLNDTGLESLFEQGSDGRYTPRALFLDTDPMTAVKLRSGPLKSIFPSDPILITEKSEARNYGDARYCLRGDEEKILNRLRKLAEACDMVDVHLYHSLGGGNSGKADCIFEKAADDFLNQKSVEVVRSTVLPSPDSPSNPTAPYHTVLSLGVVLASKNKVGQVRLFDNDALNSVFRNNLTTADKEASRTSTFADLNNIISTFTSSTLSGARFGQEAFSPAQGSLPVRADIPTSLKLWIPSYGQKSGASLAQLTEHTLFDESASLLSCGDKKKEAKSIAERLYYRGTGVGGELKSDRVNAAVKSVESDNSSCFRSVGADDKQYCAEVKSIVCPLPPLPLVLPTVARINLNARACGSPATLRTSATTASTNSVVAPPKDDTLSAVSLSSAVVAPVETVMKWFDASYVKRTFVHSYIGAGMEEGEFSEARENLEAQLKEYESFHRAVPADEEEEEEEEE